MVGWAIFEHKNVNGYFQDQPECIKDGETLHYDCGGWGVSAQWEVPQVSFGIWVDFPFPVNI